MKSKIYSYYRLLRGTNLIFIILIMYVLRYFLVVPWMRMCNDFPFFSDSLFRLLVMAVVFIAAAGYVINDYFDQQIDGINKSNKQIIGVSVSESIATRIFWIFAVIGSLIGIYISFKIGHLNLGSIFLVASFMVYYYSLKYKRLLLWGNLVVAFLSSLVILLPWLFEFFTLLSRPIAFVEHAKCLAIIRQITFLFVGFSFLMTLIREWIKDLEDQLGDEVGGRITLPIRFGVKGTKMIIFGTSLFLFLLIVIAQWVLVRNHFESVVYYSIITISAPLLYLIFKLSKAITPSDYHFLSSLAKGIMFLGILLLVVSYLLIFKFQY